MRRVPLKNVLAGELSRFAISTGGATVLPSVLFRQLVDDDLGCASYLLGDTTAGVAVAVDPHYAIEPLLEAAARAGVRIVRVLETHTHADHVSGHGRLALEHGVPVSIHPLAVPEHPFDPLADGDAIRVGSIELRVVHTPGHRPEHCSFLVPGELVLTGDSLFVGDAARPDLAVEPKEGAEGLYHSLRRLAELPDAVAVYPGHVAGSLCGRSLSSEPSSTIGAERRTNPMLALDALEPFVAASTSVAVPRPPTVERCVALNRGPFLGAPAALEQLSSPGGAVVLDVRDPHAFAAGHLRGAVNVPVAGSSFATRAAFVLPPGPIALHADSCEQAERAARRLQAAGLVERAVGYLVDPPGATDRLEPVAVADVDPRTATIVDVREPHEALGSSIPGAVSIPYREVGSARLAGPVVTICESGARAAIAASVLVRNGVDARPVLDGGVGDYLSRSTG
jgi:hydroxyacylglutathione hydrolase